MDTRPAAHLFQRLFRYVIAVLLLANAIIGFRGWWDDIQGWWAWLAMLDECGVRISMATAAGLILLAPAGYTRLKNWYTEKINAERLCYISRLEAMEIVLTYVRPALRNERPGIGLSVTNRILKSFAATCPDGMRENEAYNGHLLHQWIRDNAIKILISHLGELKPKDQKEKHGT